jgi:arginine decarboxylase-like protein
MQKTVPLPKRWSIADAVELYGIQEWSNGFFRISDEGNILVTSRPWSTNCANGVLACRFYCGFQTCCAGVLGP